MIVVEEVRNERFGDIFWYISKIYTKLAYRLGRRHERKKNQG